MGLIPAHAGKTTRGAAAPHCCAAHPRSRGENLRQDGHEGVHAGSSPLTRGKLDEVHVLGPGERLIPAHAGKTARPAHPPGCSRAHPRSRGENESRSIDWDSASGSSPLTRGKRHRSLACRCGRRLIPAHAGKTVMRRDGAIVLTAHPRSRGENWYVRPRPRTAVGSSPLTRGKQGRI